MAASIKKNPAPPLGVVASLASGFEAVNARLELAALPLALDAFLWLGPHLSVKPLIVQTQEALGGLASLGVDPVTITAWRQAFGDLGEWLNVFSRLSTSPLGLPSLMAVRGSIDGPLGRPVQWPLEDPLVYLLVTIGLGLIGLWLGALYLGGIALQVRDGRLDWQVLAHQVWGDWARLTALAFVALFVFGALMVPLSVVVILLAMFSLPAAGVAQVLGGVVLLWIFMFGAFTLHGMLLGRRGFFTALWDSLRLVRASLPQTSGLFALILVIGLGLNAVWQIPPDNSWLLAIALIGHAVVSTALFAATFAFYQDRYRWWLETRATSRRQWQQART